MNKKAWYTIITIFYALGFTCVALAMTGYDSHFYSVSGAFLLLGMVCLLVYRRNRKYQPRVQ